ncbi:restriction endonuclease [Erwinia phyllosphaerae]|nr:restriction endonuclease [Erwinia phyllosphaerae]
MGATYGVVVTNATYTRSARQLANAEGVLLIHHEELPQLKEMLGL